MTEAGDWVLCPTRASGGGLRHQIGVILVVAGCAVVAGAHSFTAIGEWAAHASDQLLAVLGGDVRAE